MNRDSALLIAQVVVSLVLIVAVMLQNKGAGLGQAFGADAGIYHTKQGLEKRLHQFTVVLAVAFLLLAAIQLIV